MTETEKAWAAGFVDGEGCITIIRLYQQHWCGPRYALQVSVSNCYLPVLTWFKQLTGFGVIARVTHTSSKHLPAYVWRIGGQQAASVLSELLPYLVVKYAQALIGIEFAKSTKPHGKGVGVHTQLTQAEVSYRDSLVSKLKKLKRRRYAMRRKETSHASQGR